MSAKMEADYGAIDELVDELTRWGESAHAVSAQAIYKGAAVTAEQVKKFLRSVPTEPGRAVPNARNAKGQLHSATPDEIRELEKHVGIAKFADDGTSISTAVGFGGYFETATRKYPNGLPAPLIARSINSGSSVRQKSPFFRKALKKGSKMAMYAMTLALQEGLEKSKTGR